MLGIIGRVRCNVRRLRRHRLGQDDAAQLPDAFIDDTERIITCEDAAELQLQQPHVVRLETRPPNLEGTAQITMRDLVKNCLRMRPERIIVGEVRGPGGVRPPAGDEHRPRRLDGHAARQLAARGHRRIESMITMGGFALPSKTIREMIVGSVDVIIQAARLRDGSRRITHVTEVMGLEGDVIITQDLFVYEITGEDANGRSSAATAPPASPGRASGTRPLLRPGARARRSARRDGAATQRRSRMRPDPAVTIEKAERR